MGRLKKIQTQFSDGEKTIKIGDVIRMNRRCYDSSIDGTYADVRWRVDEIYDYHVVGTLLPYGYRTSYTFTELRDREIISQLPIPEEAKKVEGYRRVFIPSEYAF